MSHQHARGAFHWSYSHHAGARGRDIEPGARPWTVLKSERTPNQPHDYGVSNLGGAWGRKFPN